ncbi:putative integral membrane protein [Xylariales sp. PMI_506]|nr:putative integral membrane protein [Xylariales sp. PMI_506]
MWSIAGMPIIDRNHVMVVVGFLFTTLAVIVVSLRAYTRAVVIKLFGWDDILVCAAMGSSIGFFIAAMFQIKYGLGELADPEKIVNFLKAIYVTIMFYNLTQTLYKLSMTLQSYRLFTTHRGQRIMQAVLVWIVLCGLMTFCGSLFYCNPIPKAWDDSIPGHCANRSDIIYACAAFNIFNDIILLCIPIPFIVSLQVKKRERIVLISIFSSGLFTTIVSIIRIKSLYDSMSQAVVLQTVTGVDIAMWSQLEINIAIIMGSVPALKSFVSNVILKKMSSSARSQGYASYGRSAHKNTQNDRPAFSKSSDEEGNISSTEDGKGPKMAISVTQDIEMRSFPVDDQHSEKGLIHDEPFTAYAASHVYVNSSGRTKNGHSDI